MPEQLTRHPEVTLQVLRSAGAQCGEGAEPQILSRCPAERFCKLPGGEVCVYGLDQAGWMTQISGADWQPVLAALPATASASQAVAAGEASAAGGMFIGLAVGLVGGAVLGVLGTRRRRLRR